MTPHSRWNVFVSRQAWIDACKALHTYVSAIDGSLDRACDERRYTDPGLIEFAICFLEVDPWFFRSGYLKQVLLTRLKRSDLDPPDKERLSAVSIDAVKQLQVASVGIDRARASRARMMLKHIAQAPAEFS